MKTFLRHAAGLLAPLLLIAALWVGSYGVAYLKRHADKPMTYGVSFSTKYADELGIDGRDAYRSLLGDMDFTKVRLMSYWDRIEPREGEFAFEELDWQFDQANQHGVTVSLALGYRQPRWPECHPPTWIDRDDFRDELVRYLEAVVVRYRDHPALDNFQLENEVANRHFGECDEFPFDKQLLTRESRLVKQLAPDVPLVINASNQAGVPLIGNTADKVGFSIYRVAHLDYGPYDGYWSYWYTPAIWHSFRAELVERWVDVPVFVHELQLEPWGPTATAELSIEKQNESMPVDQIRASLDYVDRTNITEAYLWGGEWWYWRKEHLEDPSVWNTVKERVESATMESDGN